MISANKLASKSEFDYWWGEIEAPLLEKKKKKIAKI